MAVNKIIIESLSFSCHIGVCDIERASAQTLICTLELALDFEKCCMTDQIEDTINYVEVAEVLQAKANEKAFNLLESLASYLSNAIMQEFHPMSLRMWLTKKIQKFPFSVTIEYSLNDEKVR